MSEEHFRETPSTILSTEMYCKMKSVLASEFCFVVAHVKYVHTVQYVLQQCDINNN